MRYAELLGTLSLATDAGTGVAQGHGLRAAIAAARLGGRHGVARRTVADAYYLALLRYTGCTADAEMSARLFGDEVEFGELTQGMDYGDPREMVPAVLRRAARGKGVVRGAVAAAGALRDLLKMREVGRAHCEVAVLLARRLGFDDALCEALGKHGDRWDGSGMTKAKRDAIPIAMRLAHVAADVEIGHRLGGCAGARARVAKLRGRSLDPDLADAFAAHAADVCAALDAPAVWDAFLAAEPAPARGMDGAALDEGCATIAAFADLKSTYTRGHSPAVAELAAAAAAVAKLPPDTIRDLRRAHVGSQDLDRDSWRAFGQMFYAAFPDAKHTIEQVHVAGDHVTVVARFSGTHRGAFMNIPPTGRRASVQVITVDRVVDGRVVEHTGQLDSAGLVQQLTA